MSYANYWFDFGAAIIRKIPARLLFRHNVFKRLSDQSTDLFFVAERRLVRLRAHLVREVKVLFRHTFSGL